MKIYKIIAVCAFIFSLLSLFAISIGAFWLFIMKTDSVVPWAVELYPLDKNHKYIIQRNTALLNKDGRERIPANTFYVLTIPGEAEPQHNQFNSGRKIGGTSVDLERYEGKEVYIEGYFYQGAPMFLQPAHTVPMFLRSKNQVVLHVDNVYTEQTFQELENIRLQLPPPL